MRIAIAGAGAVGGVLAAYLADGEEHEISLLARGKHLEAIRRDGLRVHSRNREMIARVAASDDATDLGPQDIVFVTVKGHRMGELLPALEELRGPGTVFVAAQNGIPWWYLHAGGEESGPLEAVDPGGAIWNTIGPEHVVGCVMEELPATLIGPGVVRHADLLSLSFGAPRPGCHAQALEVLAASFRRVGAKVALSDDIRRELWHKLLLNIAVGPTSVLTGATMGELDTSEGLKAVQKILMREGLAVAHASKVDLRDDVEERVERGSGITHHKPSMLQDFEAGRPMEVEPILSAVIGLAGRHGVEVPMIASLTSLVRLRERIAERSRTA